MHMPTVISKGEKGPLYMYHVLAFRQQACFSVLSMEGGGGEPNAHI